MINTFVLEASRDASLKEAGEDYTDYQDMGTANSDNNYGDYGRINSEKQTLAGI